MKPKRAPFIPSPLLAAAFILLSCQAVVPALRATEKPKEAAGTAVVVPSLPPPWPTPSPPAFGKRQFYVTTQPEDAQVFIDGRFYGLTPLLLPDFAFGHYFLELVKDGYERSADWVDYNDVQWAFFYALARAKGFLDLRVMPPDSEIRTASRTLRPGLSELPAGGYTLTASAFGYVAKTVEATVKVRETAVVELALEKATFAFSGLAFSRRSFNPHRPGPGATVTLHFTVSAPGSGVLTVTAADGRQIARLEPLAFAAAEQTVRWNGRTGAGDVAPDGTYAFVLRGQGEGETRPVEARLEVAIDSTLSVEHASLWSGSAGLFYAPSTLVLPDWNVELNASALAGFAGLPGLSAPVALGARVGLGGGQEAAVGLAALFGEAGAPAFVPSLSWKCRLFATPGAAALSGAVQAKAAYQFNGRADFFADATGVSAGFPLRLALGPFSLYLAPEFIVALYKVNAESVPGAYAWFYGRAGLALNVDIITVGISASVRTAPLDEGLAVALPVQTALEISVSIPDSPLYLSAVAVAEWEAAAFRGWGGFGFGLLW